MGKPTGFLEIDRVKDSYEPVAQRITHYREFVPALTDDKAKLQGARCMDCGIPFCNNGCPVNNVIPDFNDLVYRQDWENALTVLHSTNNFPEFTGRICPAPCEAACTLGINDDPVGIKSIERAIIDKAWDNGWVVPQVAAVKTGKKVAIVGSGPAGLAAAQQLARVGHAVTVFEKNDAVGGLLRYGIPDFKLGQDVIDRRVAQLKAEGIEFKTNSVVGSNDIPAGIVCDGKTVITPAQLDAEFDAVILAGGAEVPRDLPVAGRDLQGVHYALELLIAQNKQVGGGAANPINAAGKHVVVIGGGDTGSDCVGTSNRHGAVSVTQLELMPQPPEQENKSIVWPYWPVKMRTSSSHEEGVERDFAVQTQEFVGENGVLKAVKLVRLEWKDGKPTPIAGSEFELKADLVFLAMGFTNPVASLLDAFGVEKDARGNAKATTDGVGCYQTSVAKVFAAGDVRRGQSLVVWAIREGRQAAREVDQYLMGASVLPR
ncbi:MULTISPECIES: glutamate synthase subunit beta [Deefgea]|uniref:Glutamate synthase small subunit n=1 Tax=Deefgea chitinilytica TaxID=570276 RepID=A0ABS2CEK6_9NEIS|nr:MULTISPECIES: glutamate synthase subunit beta [Deefgea]MBM5571821.1 glutamate synthase small subunit [Deefgea chitinilytica]MBM9889056.1 glutamate synthase subunit beta [Deefgea sp. CFH1-16]